MYKYRIIHGDEHLNNFMLTRDNPSEIKIIDFGRFTDRNEIKRYSTYF